MTYRPELEGFITKQTLPFLIAHIPVDSEGYRADDVGEADNGALIFECDGEKFSLLNKSMNIQKVPVTEDPPVGVARGTTDLLPVSEGVDVGESGLLNVEFTSAAALDLATESGLTASDFTGKGSGKDGAFTVADVKERIKEDA